MTPPDARTTRLVLRRLIDSGVQRRDSIAAASKRCAEAKLTRVNVGDAERQASVIGGSMLALVGVLRGSLSGLVLVALGGALVYRGITGHCHMYEAMGHSTADQSQSTGASWARS